VAIREHPTTSVDVHLLIDPGRMPAISAAASIIRGSESLFCRIEVDDMPPATTGQARHRLGVSISGPRQAVLDLLARWHHEVRTTPIPVAGDEGGGQPTT
jgi:hypothetical protein